MNLESKDETSYKAVIKEVSPKDMPLKKNGWKFNWKQLAKNKNRKFFALYVDSEIQGMLSVEIVIHPSEIKFYLHHIEVAPHNYGADGEFYQAAGCLLSYACRLSLNWLEKDNPYLGFVLFESKTDLIKRYENVYGANLIAGQSMCFTPEAGIDLIEKYLDN